MTTTPTNKELLTQEFNLLLEDIKNSPEDFLNLVKMNFPDLAKIAESEEETSKYLENSEKENRKHKSFWQKTGEKITRVNARKLGAR